MLTCVPFWGVGLLAASAAAKPAAATAVPAPPEVTWSTPSKDARGSMPIGNGDIGANVWVEPDGDLLFHVSKTDAWSENGRLLKLGKVRVRCDPPLHAEGMRFEQRLDLSNGVIRIESGDDARRASLSFRIDANHPAVFITLESDSDVDLSATFEPWRTARRELKGHETHSAYGLHGTGGPPVFVEPDIVVSGRTDAVVWYHRNARSIWADNLKLQALGEWTGRLEDPLLHRTFGVLMRGAGLTNASPTRLVSAEPRRRFELRLVALTEQTPTAGAWLEAVEALDRSIPAGSDAYPAHAAWWKAFWERSWIAVGGDDDAERVSRAYALQRWINAGSGRGNSPIKFNGSIFTIEGSDKGNWDADYRRWGGAYWWQNTRLPYWGMLASGDVDLMRPLFDMFLDSLPLRKAATRAYYNHEGAFYPETQYFWGTYVDGNWSRGRSRPRNEKAMLWSSIMEWRDEDTAEPDSTDRSVERMRRGDSRVALGR